MFKRLLWFYITSLFKLLRIYFLSYEIDDTVCSQMETYQTEHIFNASQDLFSLLSFPTQRIILPLLRSSKPEISKFANLGFIFVYSNFNYFIALSHLLAKIFQIIFMLFVSMCFNLTLLPFFPPDPQELLPGLCLKLFNHYSVFLQ